MPLTTEGSMNKPEQSEETKAPQNAEFIASTSSSSTRLIKVTTTTEVKELTTSEVPVSKTVIEDDNSPPLSKKKKTNNIYRKEWKTSVSWFQPSEKGTQFAYCKVCKVDIELIKGKLTLNKHAKEQHTAQSSEENTAKTSKGKSLTSNQKNKITDGFEIQTKRTVAKTEIKLSLFLAQHYLAFNLIDEIPILVKNICSSSEVAENVQYSQTKATAILRHVTGAVYFQNLCSLMIKNKFSVIIDASTDSLETNVCVVVRISNDFKITDFVYTFFTLQKLDAKAIYDKLVASFNDNGIDYKANLIGFCAQEADVMMGVNSSVLSNFKTDVPHLFEIRCICHFSHDCAAQACSKLPQSTEDLCRYVFNYIQMDRKRIPNEFQALSELKSNTVLHSSQTRLLSKLDFVNCFREKYESLKAYFRTKNVLQTGNIYGKLNNPIHYLYLCFLSHGLTFFTKLNDCMQSEEPKIQTMYIEIETHLKSLLKCYLKRSYFDSINNVTNIDYVDPRNHLPYEEIIFGTEVNECLSNASSSFEPDVLTDFRRHCLEFYVEGTKQMFTRFNLNNYRALKEIEKLSPKNVKHESVQSIFSLITHFANLGDEDSFSKIGCEWEKLVCFIRTLNNIPEEMEEFWKMVGKEELPDKSMAYPLLTKFVFEVLSLPHSSGRAERAVSEVNLIKSEVKNNLDTDLIVGLLYSNDLMKNQKYFEFKITEALIDNYLKIQNNPQNQ